MPESSEAAPAPAVPLAERVLSERLGLIIAQTPQGVAGPAALATIGALVLWDRASPWPLSATLVALFAVLASWLAFFLRHRRERPPPSEARAWLGGTVARTLAHGACWGAFSLIAFRSDSILHQSVDVAFMYGLVAGAVVVDGPFFPAFVAFALPTLVPVVVRCYLVGEGASIAVGSAGLVGLGHGLFAALNASRLTEASIRNSLEKLDLLRELERQRELAESARREAEAANREKSRFLAAASHDLRQPVHALSLFAAAAELAPSDAERKKLVEQIGHSVASLSALFDALLEVSRLDAGVLEPRFSDVPLRDVLTRLVAELSPEARRRGLALRVHARELFVRTDRVLLERLLRNLLTNALTYTERGGVLLSARRRGGNVRVEVWDTGVGMPKAELARVFEPFYQIEGAQKSSRPGVGLGLSIVERVGRLLGHPVDVVSRIGRGSRFGVELPLAVAGQADATAQRPEPSSEADTAPLMGAVIVVIDDEPAVRAALDVLLRQFGSRVVTVASAAEARSELARSELTPDIVLSDFRLGAGETGLGAVTELRKVYGADLPAALVTGDTGADRLKEVSESGLPTLHKPVSADALKRLVLRLLEAAR